MSKGEKMQCHYEVIECTSRTVSADEIKKQYKRLALKWHPDRNFGQEELATSMFKKVSAAYAVLSDPQERKWYDDHRESILRGGDGTNKGSGGGGGGGGGGGSRGLDEDVTIDDLWHYFNTSCFSGFEDRPDGKGFYQVYGSIFQAVTQQEDAGSEGLTDAPPFGDVLSPRADVLQFYNYWLNFVTCLSFSWEDEHNPSDAPNRDVRRAIEKENKKAREAGRKKYIDIVRALAAYVHKRDPRMEAIEAEKQRKKEEDEARRKRAQQDELARRAEARQRRLELGGAEGEVERLRRQEERKGAYILADEEEEEDDEEDEEEEEEGDGVVVRGVPIGVKVAIEGEHEQDNDEEAEDVTFDCEVCSKFFKTPSQLEQHCQSKAHRKNVKEQEKCGKGKNGKKGVSSNTLATAPPAQPAQPRHAFSFAGSSDEEEEEGEEGLRAAVQTLRLDKTKGKKTAVKGVKDGDDDEDDCSNQTGEYACGVCVSRFVTRNQLFIHIKALGHALPIIGSTSSSKSEGGKKAKKKKKSGIRLHGDSGGESD